MGGRGRGGGGWGRGRGAFTAPPMGLTHADLQNMSRDPTALYPPMIPPVLTEFTEDEKKIAAYQIGFAQRMRKSAYYVVEATKSTDLPRYSDKYRPSVASQPTLKKKDLYAPYFPPDIFEGYFNPKKKRKVKPTTDSTKKRMNIDDMADEDEDKDAPSDAPSDAGSQAPESDYDVDEEYDNDYAENYFDNGENDDNDDLGGGGGGGGDEGGGGDYD
ncbi:DNA-directed RNA polymerase III, subunit Rpc31 [Mycena alexandri]|uniref:DNA-directed RNA polymerase III subunit n=1 Tax=Mycena alexandri TaxID=1745969 RepID=A0AAD6T231_9AGAR|nr:DNA-directed RNA polymerase III, subunit Rpc31 [Mycena alexandri]